MLASLAASHWFAGALLDDELAAALVDIAEAEVHVSEQLNSPMRAHTCRQDYMLLVVAELELTSHSEHIPRCAVPLFEAEVSLVGFVASAGWYHIPDFAELPSLAELPAYAAAAVVAASIVLAFGATKTGLSDH